MPDTPEHQWRYYNELPMFPAPQWTSATQQPLYQHDARHFASTFAGAQQPIVSPSMYSETWSDTGMEMTPSPSEFPEGMQFRTHSSHSGHLSPPEREQHRSFGSTSSHSPREMPLQTAQSGRPEERPHLGVRSSTAPEHVHRVVKSSIKTSPSKRTSDEDDDWTPTGEEVVAARGRKRQRIPHTAVERRYRENLNAHLDKLRQSVPALAARKGPDGGEGVKPSKCEVLNGAIEHIGALDRENAALKNQVRTLQARITELENWYARGGSQ